MARQLESFGVLEGILSSPAAVATIIAAITAGLFGLLKYLIPDATARLSRRDDQEIREQLSDLAKVRQEPYAELWALTEKASPTHEPMTYQERMDMREAIDLWYFHSGGGQLLWRESKNLLEQAKDALSKPSNDPEVSRKAVSAVSKFRGQVRNDLGVRG